MRVLGSWWLLAVLVVWGLNDHVGKQRWPGVVTGKVSDLAGLFALPLLLAALTTLVLRPRSPRVVDRIGLSASLVVSLGFALVKISPAIADAVSSVWSHVYPTQLGADPSDLLTLAAAPPAYIVWTHVAAPSGSPAAAQLPRVGRVATIAFALLLGTAVTTATSPACDLEDDDVGSVFLGTDGALYATGAGAARSIDGGRTWQGVSYQDVPAESPDQQLAPTADEEESERQRRDDWDAQQMTTTLGGSTAPAQVAEFQAPSYEVCSVDTCWRSDLGQGTITERDLGSGATRTVRAEARGGRRDGLGSCAPPAPLAAMTLIRHDERDVLVASDATRGIIRLEAGAEPDRIRVELQRPPSPLETFRTGALWSLGVGAGIALLGYGLWHGLSRARTAGRPD